MAVFHPTYTVVVEKNPVSEEEGRIGIALLKAFDVECGHNRRAVDSDAGVASLPFDAIRGSRPVHTNGLEGALERAVRVGSEGAVRSAGEKSVPVLSVEVKRRLHNARSELGSINNVDCGDTGSLCKHSLHEFNYR